MTTLIRCPGCNQLRRPSANPCPTCTALAQRRARRALLLAAAVLTLLLLILLILSSCTPEITAPTPTPTPSGPLAQTDAQLTNAWRQWANRQGYCWCEWRDGQPTLTGDTCTPEILDIDRAAHLCPPQP